MGLLGQEHGDVSVFATLLLSRSSGFPTVLLLWSLPAWHMWWYDWRLNLEKGEV